MSALDLHRPAHGVQPLHRLPDRADRADRRRRTLWGPLIAAVVFSLLAETLRPQGAAGVPDVAGPAADPERAAGLRRRLASLARDHAGGAIPASWASDLRREREKAREEARAPEEAITGGPRIVNGYPHQACGPAIGCPGRHGPLWRSGGRGRGERHVHGGELVGIIGPNGAGKTTFSTPYRAQVPTAGSWCGGAQPGGPAAPLCRGTRPARTFQTPRVFADMPVLTNIEFGLKFAGRRRASTGCGATNRRYPGAARRGRHPDADRPVGPGRAAGVSADAVSSGCWRSAWRWPHAARACCCWTRAAGLTEAEIEDMARLIRRLRDELDLTVV